MASCIPALISAEMMAVSLCSSAADDNGASASESQSKASEPIMSALDSRGGSVVLSCGNLWDGQSDRPLGPMEILVKGGKIAEMGKKVSRPDGAEVVDLSGQTVAPGFIDCHVHMTFSPENFGTMFSDSEARALLHAYGPLNQMLMNGFTTVRDVGTNAIWYYVTVDLKHAIDQGLVVGPRMMVAPHIISSTGGHGDFSGSAAPGLQRAVKSSVIADGTSEIQRVVREEIRGGADWIKCAATGGFMSPTSDPGCCSYSQEEMEALVRTAHDLGKPVCVHTYADEGIRRSVMAGADCIEHGNFVTEKTLELMEERGTYIVPTQYTFKEALENMDNPEYWAKRPPWEHQKNVKYGQTVIDAQRNLARSNVKVAFGTDVGTFSFRDGWREFPTMVQNGISPLRALKSATSVAAELLGRQDLGTLAVGKAADIIAMPGDPFLDINFTGKVSFVMKEGKIYKAP